MGWFSSKKICTHCQVNKTHQKFEGNVTCPACENKIVMARESIRKCPVDKTDMVKEDHQGIILDRCPCCHGVWLDSDELQHMLNMSKSDTNFATGLVIGMAVS